jgi:hypothetical protein
MRGFLSYIRDPVDRTKLNTGPWTSDEDQRLVEAHQKYGADWKAIAKAVGTRGQRNCTDRYRFGPPSYTIYV